MSLKIKSSNVNLPAKVCDPSNGNEIDAKSLEVVDLLSKVEKCLEEGRPKNALEVISRSKLKSPWVDNANGVCLLRLDRAEQAVKLFRGLVLSHGNITLRVDVPTVFKTNFATALLAHNNLGGCLGILHEIHDEELPAVQQLRAAIQQFRKGLSLWEKLQWRMGMPSNGPVALDFPLGNLE